MIVTFDREPFGWVHPLYRRRRCSNRPLTSMLGDLTDFVGPALDTVHSLSHLLQLAPPESHGVPSAANRRSAQQQRKDTFEMKVDVQQFAPEELDVKMVDNFVVIEGKHEEKKDDQGFISRHFLRRYQLPEDVQPETVTCNLSSDGVLCITAPRMGAEKKNEKQIPINFTGQPAAVPANSKDAPTTEENQEPILD